MNTPFPSITGTVTAIELMASSTDDWCGCSMMVTVESETQGTNNLILTPYTFIPYQEPIQTGDTVTGFYPASAPVPLIYPPQYRLMALVRNQPSRYAALDTFNTSLISSSGLLQIIPDESTSVILPNGMPYSGPLEGKTMLVLYAETTKSIPAITTPSLIVVFCCQSYVNNGQEPGMCPSCSPDSSETAE